jgi:GNAT superfamily N-acetyltransferase
MSDSFVIRPAIPSDIPAIARHRAEMFSDMGQLPASLYPQLIDRTVEYLRHAMPAGEYFGWLASARVDDQTVIAGAGVQLRRTLPHPITSIGEHRVAVGRQAIILNVFTEKSWRRQGIAAALMQHVLQWMSTAGVDTLVLHASVDGRALYERLGFTPTSEMRYAKRLR